jgi:integrase/recombinase XerC
MNAVTRYKPAQLDVSETAGERLHRKFLAGRSPNTMRAYLRDFEAFAWFLGAMRPQDALTRLCQVAPAEGNDMLLSYQAHMKAAGLTPATCNRRLAAIRSALKYARTIGETTWSPEVEGLKVQAYRDTAGPGLDGTRAMLAIARAQEPAKAARDVALIRAMFDLGLRRGEVAGLDLANIDRDGRKVWIRGKGRAQKESRSLPEPTLAALVTWLEVRGQVAAPDETAVFVALSGPARARGRRITGRGLHHLIVALGKAAGVKTRPHGLRHASITAALDENNGDVRAVQQHARHADPRTTMRYDDNRRDLAGKVAASLANVL